MKGFLNLVEADSTDSRNSGNLRHRGSAMPNRLLSLTIGLLLLPAAALADFAAGMSAYQLGDFEAAVAEWRPLAEQGDANSQEMIGFMYLQGQGVPRGDSLAVQWYRRAAEQGHAGAQNSLGTLYENGRGTLKDYATAADWYRRAAEQNHSEAKNNLGRVYLDGRGVERDEKEALRLFSEAADAGLGRAMINLGRMYEQGRRVRVNYNTASTWYVRGAEAGEVARARARLVAVARCGSRAASNWLRQAANSGDEEAMHKLGLLYFEGIGVLQSFTLAHLWVNLSAALGNEKAAQDREVIELSMSGLEIGEARSRADAWWQDNRGDEDNKALRGGS